MAARARGGLEWRFLVKIVVLTEAGGGEAGKTLASTRKPAYDHRMNELIFDVTQEADGGFVAECLTEGIVTEGDTWDELGRNVRDAVGGYFFDRADKPRRIRLHLVRDEILAGA